jgi:hypothetical protein
MTGEHVSQPPSYGPPPGLVKYQDSYPPELSYLLQPAPPPKRRSGLKIALAVAGALVLLGGGLGYLYARPYLVEFPATLTTPDGITGMPRLTDDRSQSIGDEMTAYLRNQAGNDSSMAAFYAPDGVPGQAVLVYAGTHFVPKPGSAVNDVFAGFSRSSGLTVTDMTSTGPGAMGGTAKCGQTRMSSLPIALCVWGDHGSVGVVIGFGRTIPQTADLLRTIRPLVLHRGSAT